MAGRSDQKNSGWMRYIRRRGFEAERELARCLRGMGVLAWRIPASGMFGRGGGVSLPDVLGFWRGEFLGFQVKATGKERFVVYRRLVEPLCVWRGDVVGHGVGARGFVAVRFSGGRWVVREVECSEEKIVVGVGESSRLREQLAVVLGVQEVLE